jgi:hypothetical protein
MLNENELKERGTRGELVQERKPPDVVMDRKILESSLPSEITEMRRGPVSRPIASWATLGTTRGFVRGR